MMKVGGSVGVAGGVLGGVSFGVPVVSVVDDIFIKLFAVVTALLSLVDPARK